ncbi:MAG: 1-deoxy-D-xylulose-5-phosphate synthase N-terminal domain-containing protein [Phycisphaerales bacterium]
MELRILPTIQTPDALRALPIDRLPELAAEIRHAICDQVSRSGGHLAPNLGVVELTIALHYVFDFGHDRLLFDVGHQCYPHKLLTGRLPLLANLRKRNGMAGFPEPRESAYDPFPRWATPERRSRPPWGWPAATRSTARAGRTRIRAEAARR